MLNFIADNRRCRQKCWSCSKKKEKTLSMGKCPDWKDLTIWFQRSLEQVLDQGFYLSGCLVSAGIELVFFLVAGIVVCFGYSTRMMLITH